MWNSSSIWMAIHGWWVEFSFKIIYGPWKSLGTGHWINLSGGSWIYLSLNRSIYFAIGTIWWPWSYKLGHVKTTKIGAEEVHPPKNRLIFPQPEGYNYHFNSVFGHRTWLPASCACSTLPRSSLKRCNAWKIGLTWLTMTWVDPWQRSTHHFSEYLATRDYD